MTTLLEEKSNIESKGSVMPALAPLSWREEKDIALLKDMPVATEREMETWSGNKIHKQRSSERYYRFNEARDAITQIGKSDKKSLLLEGEGGAGKSTTILEIHELLNTQQIPHALFSPKKWSTSQELSNYMEESLGKTLTWLKTYSEQSNAQLIVLIDSGDYMFLPPGNGSTKQEYMTKMKELFITLHNPKFKIITTWHPDWPLDNRDKKLFPEWQKLFPEDSRIKISNTVDPNIGVDMIIDQGKVKIDKANQQEEKAILFLIAQRLNTMQIKDLDNEKFQLIKNKIRQLPIGQWENEIDVWVKNLN